MTRIASVADGDPQFATNRAEIVKGRLKRQGRLEKHDLYLASAIFEEYTLIQRNRGDSGEGEH